MDPLQRGLLATSYRALENGMSIEPLRQSPLTCGQPELQWIRFWDQTHQFTSGALTPIT